MFLEHELISMPITILLIVLGNKFILISSHGGRATHALQLTLDIIVHMLILFILVAVLASSKRSAPTTTDGTTSKLVVQGCGRRVTGNGGVEVTAIADGAVGG
jgi:hypothetical protein